MRVRTVSQALGALGLVVYLAACSPGESKVTVVGPQPPQPKIAITTSPVVVPRGGVDTVRISITRTDYTSVVGVTFGGLPNGVTIPSISTTSTNAFRIPIRADSNATLGTVTATISASGTEVANVTAQLSVTVTAR